MADQPIRYLNRRGVGGRRNRAAAQLLGAGVIGRHQPRRRFGSCDGFARISREQVGDAEIEQLRRAVFSHQDVARLAAV